MSVAARLLEQRSAITGEAPGAAWLGALAGLEVKGADGWGPLTRLRLHGLVAEGLFGIWAEHGHKAARELRVAARRWPVTARRVGHNEMAAERLVPIDAALTRSAHACARRAANWLACKHLRLLAGPLVLRNAAGRLAGGIDGLADGPDGLVGVELQCVQRCSQLSLLGKKRSDKWARVGQAWRLAAVPANDARFRACTEVVVLTLEVDLKASGEALDDPALSVDLGTPGAAGLLQWEAKATREGELLLPDERPPRKRVAAPAETPKRMRQVDEAIEAEDAVAGVRGAVSLARYVALRWTEDTARCNMKKKVAELCGKWGWTLGEGGDVWRQRLESGGKEAYLCKKKALLAKHRAEFGL